MHSNLIENLKKGLRLTKKQREVIVGLMLGDGHLETVNKGQTYRLKIEQSVKHKAYVIWLKDIFKEWVRQPVLIKKRLSPNGKIIYSAGFGTYSHGAFRFYKQQFYTKDGRKKIPDKIKKWLSPLSLSIWFMDDGSWKSNNHRTYVLHTDGYEKKDLVKIVKALEEKFRIKSSLHKQYENWRVYIQTDSAEQFRNLIKPHIITSMMYKLGNILPKK